MQGRYCLMIKKRSPAIVSPNDGKVQIPLSKTTALASASFSGRRTISIRSWLSTGHHLVSRFMPRSRQGTFPRIQTHAQITLVRPFPQLNNQTRQHHVLNGITATCSHVVQFHTSLSSGAFRVKESPPARLGRIFSMLSSNSALAQWLRRPHRHACLGAKGKNNRIAEPDAAE